MTTVIKLYDSCNVSYYLLKPEAQKLYKILSKIPNLTSEICVEFLKMNGTLLTMCKTQTLEMCVEACKQNPNVFQSTQHQTEEMCLDAIRLDPLNIQWIKCQTEEMCLMAIEKNPTLFTYMNNPSVAVTNAVIKSIKGVYELGQTLTNLS